jgi:hypothetical protein
VPEQAGSLPITGAEGGKTGLLVTLDVASAKRTLSPNTPYYYRVVAAQAVQTVDTISWVKPAVDGPIQSFTTGSQPAEIAGTVTSAVTKAPLQHVKVCEYPIEHGNGNACAETNASGEYALVVGLAGRFVVYFDTTEKGLVPRTFYNGVYSGSEATPITVGEEAKRSGIDEALAEGGRIAGSVTNASTQAAIEGVHVCAQLPEAGQIAGGLERHRTCAATDSSGGYTITSLPPGEGVPAGGYEVEFTSELDYIPQFYNGKSERWQATLIPITPGNTVAGVDARLAEGGEITGRLTSAVTKAPIGGASACAGEICALTNASGEYTISRLPSGEYPVLFNGPEGGEYIAQYYGGKPFPNEVKVAVTAPHVTSGIDGELNSYGRIGGEVIDQHTKQPIPGVVVCLRERGGCDTTDANGEYAFKRLEAGEYALNFSAYEVNQKRGTNYLSQLAGSEYLTKERSKAMNPEANHVIVNMGATTTIDDELEEGGRISGTMLNADTREPAGVFMCAEDLSAVAPELTTVCPHSLSGDTYTLSELPAGMWRVAFGNGLPAYYFKQYYHDKDLQSEAQAISITPGANVTGIDADLIPNKHPWEGAIAGTVTAASNAAPLAGIEVCVEPKVASAECVTTDAGGKYLLEGLPNGEYSVAFSSPPGSGLNFVRQFYQSASSVKTATHVSVLWGNITPKVDAQLHEGGRVAGKVTDAATGLPVSKSEVCVSSSSGEISECTATNSGGEYVTPPLANGEYYVEFAGGGKYQTQFYDHVSTRGEANAVSVREGSTTAGIDAQLNAPPSGTGVAGTVRSAATKAPIEGIEVCAAQIGPETPLVECTLTSAGGQYALNRLVSGDYEVEFSTPEGSALNYVRQYYKGKPLPSEAQAVPVAAGSITAGIGAELTEGGRIAGTVRSSATSAPIEGALACALTSGGEPAECAFSTASGAYAIVLASGDYKVAFNAPGYGVQYYNNQASPGAAAMLAVSTGSVTSGVDASLHPLAELPAAIAPPTISGEAVVGRILHVTHALWTNAPTSYIDEWGRCGSSGAIATCHTVSQGEMYTVGVADVGHTIRVRETASNAKGAGHPAFSSPTAVVTTPLPPVPNTLATNSPPAPTSGALAETTLAPSPEEIRALLRGLLLPRDAARRSVHCSGTAATRSRFMPHLPASWSSRGTWFRRAHTSRPQSPLSPPSRA